jgi:hypothetical protein
MPDILAMLTHERDKMNRAIEALGGEIGGALGRIARLGRLATQRKRTVSPEARAKMAAGQKARWAKTKGQTAQTKATAKSAAKSAPKAVARPAAPFIPPKKKFTMSPEARARISAGARARWAKIKSGK